MRWPVVFPAVSGSPVFLILASVYLSIISVYSWQHTRSSVTV